MTRVRQRGLRLIRGVATAVAVPLGVLVFWLQISSGMSLLTILLTDLLFIPVGLLLISAVLVLVSRSARWRPSFNVDR